jgi:uncharacterized protein
VVLDANVLVSGLLSREGPPGRILDAWLAGHVKLFISPNILEELQRVLQYPRIHQRLVDGQAEQLLEQLSLTSGIVDGTLDLHVLSRDPSDNVYLACAVEAGADYLVTGNLDHFEEAGATYQGVSILSPRAFLDLMELI